jgi:hypothetical protein
MTRSPLAPGDPHDISFTSPATGWALFPRRRRPTRSGVALVCTTDAGKTWTALASN